MVRFIDDNNLEALFGRLVDLLGLCHFLEKVLNDYSVKIADVRRCYFKVIYGSNDIELELAVRGRLENTRVNLDLFYTWPIELSQCCDYPRLLSSA